MLPEVVSVRLVKTVLVVVVLVAAVAGFFVWVPYGPTTETFVEVDPGTGSAGIAKELEQAGVIRSRYAFEAVRFWKEATDRARSQTLKAGEYRFDHPASPLEVYSRLRRGDVYTISVVVPEGYNLFDIAGAVEAAGLGPKAAFLKSATVHVELIRQWSPHAVSLEGYLFPDTYKFSRHATPLQMQAAMVKRFGQEMQRLGVGLRDSASHPSDDEAVARMGHPTDVAELVTLASLVEKEVHFDDERAEVASVFENRLAAGMPLQTDPAVIYASLLRGTWTGVIHQSELHSDSAYNTYAHKGLPPGPICSPGVAALRAAMHPAKTDYLYFVADASGRTRFATTLGEHNGNVAAYRAGAKR
jgi:UPF0755 protein